MAMKVYYPEMGEAVPECAAEATQVSGFYFVETAATLAGRGIKFLSVLTADRLVAGSRKLGWNEYRVTPTAMRDLRQKMDIALDLPL